MLDFLPGEVRIVKDYLPDCFHQLRWPIVRIGGINLGIVIGARETRGGGNPVCRLPTEPTLTCRINRNPNSVASARRTANHNYCAVTPIIKTCREHVLLHVIALLRWTPGGRVGIMVSLSWNQPGRG